jgi:transcriptional regulator with XRE-family HTH domain
MQNEDISRTELAEKLGKTSGRVSQVLNNPGNLGIRTIVEYTRALGMKVAIIAYDDGDPDNDKGPIIPEVFVRSWEKLDRPNDLFEVESSASHTDLLFDRMRGYTVVGETPLPITGVHQQAICA